VQLNFSGGSPANSFEDSLTAPELSTLGGHRPFVGWRWNLDSTQSVSCHGVSSATLADLRAGYAAMHTQHLLSCELWFHMYYYLLFGVPSYLKHQDVVLLAEQLRRIRNFFRSRLLTQHLANALKTE